MKKSLFYVALGAMVLTSCAQDEVLDTPKDGVQFRVVAENAGRGTVETTNDIDDFIVKAFNVDDYDKNGSVFMNDMKVYRTKSGDTWSDWTYNSTKFWPNKGEVNFYSYSPANLGEYATVSIGAVKQVEGNGTVNKGAQTITYTVPTDAASQIDILYALNTGMSKADKNVPVNFRHALSQVVFKAKCVKSDLKVDIQSIRIANLKTTGTFAWPDVTTVSPNYSGQDAMNPTEIANQGWGEWTINETPLASYPVAMAADPNAEDTYNFLLTSDGTTETTLTDVANPLLLLPQTLNPTTTAVAADGLTKMTYGEGQQYFAIACKIWSVEGDVETLLWPATDTYAEVAIPVSSPTKNAREQKIWMQGRKYVYTFVFGEGAGYIGEGQDNEGDPVLVPVTFTVTVDQFQTATESIDMNTENNSVTGTVGE